VQLGGQNDLGILGGVPFPFGGRPQAAVDEAAAPIELAAANGGLEPATNYQGSGQAPPPEYAPLPGLVTEMLVMSLRPVR
jgi:hypothetical protein